MKKRTSILLTLIMVFTLMPIGAQAECADQASGDQKAAVIPGKIQISLKADGDDLDNDYDGLVGDEDTGDVDDTDDVSDEEEHQWGEWEVDEEASCFEEGLEVRYCEDEDCDASQERTIPAYGAHDWGKWEVTKKATCLSTGKKTRECERCGEEETAVIPKLSAKVSLKKTSLSLKKKKSYTLKLKSKTDGDKIAKWTSSNKKVASVTSKGKVTAKKKGSAVITLKMKSGATAACKVKVK
ncbi:MAG: Ig-like domain-containing protein [Lachnospiraceae bacterium]|nr:Ig-like domain-containing protein [Lachnospiraceae bacterium]